MTTAAVHVSDNAIAAFAVATIAAGFLFGTLLWMREGQADRHDRDIRTLKRKINRLTYQMSKLLEHLGVDIPEPEVDDSPAAEAVKPDEMETWVEVPDHAPYSDAYEWEPVDTEEFPAVPATQPDGIAIQVQSALIEQRDLTAEFPHPVDSAERKAKNAANIEEQLKRFDFSGRNR
jgi:hypothetical protein